MLLELRLAVRRLRASPAFTLTAIATLALAIGATTAMLGVLDAVLLRHLPFHDPGRLAVVWTEVPSRDAREGRSAFGTVDAWRRDSRSIEDLAVLDPVSLTLTRGGEVDQVSGARVSPNLFALVGIAPERGRVFTDRDAIERQRVALIGHRFWHSRFGSSPDAIGASVLIDGQPSRIVGVLPASMARAGFDADVWEPHTLFLDWEARRVATGVGPWFVFARLRATDGFDAAGRELSAIAQRVAATQPGADHGRIIRVVPLRAQLTGARPRAVAWLLAGATLLLWLVAAVNVAGLSLARGLGRLPQLAIAAALGASRARLVRSLLVESAVLVLLAGTAGVAVAIAATRAIRGIGPAYVARLADVRLDGYVLGWAVAVSAATGLLVGLPPALAAWRRDLRVTGVDGGRRSAGASARLRQLFVIGQCAAAILLLAGAGLLARSWWNVSRVDPGFRPDRVVSLNVAPPADLPPAQRAAFYDAVLERVAALPGVERAGISSELFVGTVGEVLVTAEGGDRPGGQRIALRRDEIAGDAFETLGTPLLRGRAFTRADGRGPAPVAIVNVAMASRMWPGLDAVGRRFTIGPPAADSPVFTVVGVVADMRRQGLETAAVPQMFEPVAQAPSRRAILFVRASGADPLAGAGALRGAVRAVDPHAVVYRPTLVGERLGQAIAERRVQTALLVGCAAMTLLLATLGLYALIQQSVVTRTHEIGVRMALGARPADIGRMVVGEGLVLALAGLAAGLAGAWWLARAVSTLLFGVAAFDPPTMAAVSLLALAIAAAAAWLPARRAARVAPIVALRRRAL